MTFELEQFSAENPTPFPSFAKRRSGLWVYCSWFGRPSDPSNVVQGHFNELVQRSQRSDHGEERVVDIYPEGVTCYYRERKEEHE